MALDLTGLTEYVDQFKFDLSAQAVTEAKTAKMVGYQAGVKLVAALNYLDIDVVLQDDTCDAVASGNTTLTQKEVRVYKITDKQAMCIKDLEKYWIGQKMRPGSHHSDIPFHEAYAKLKLEKIAEVNEKLIWQGDRTPGSPAPADTDMLRINGFLTVLADEGGYINGNPTSITTGTGITVSNVRSIVDQQVILIPESIAYRNDLVMFTSYSIYNTYTLALRNANLFHNAGDNGNMECTIAGTNIRLVAVPGLAGKNVFVTTYLENLVVATDSTSDEDTFEMYWAQQGDRKFHTDIAYKLGTAIKYTSLVVYFKLV